MYTPPTDEEIGAMTGRERAMWFPVEDALDIVAPEWQLEVDLGHLAGVHLAPGESVVMMLPVRITANGN